ncbi:MAG: radical SAM protein [Prevotellaceae bacterium]|nr:radical SAM protein [Prevotellaceae bacterium]
MKIGLIDVDGHNFPNLALMKLAAYHKAMGDRVEWVNYFERYDKVYLSKVFTFTSDIYTSIQADVVERGGTGYDIHKKLPAEIDCMQPDYSIYPVCSWYDGKTAYGFLTRGCIRKCSWCIVPQKEGMVRPCRDIEDILQRRNAAVLMDNNILATGEYGIQQLKKIAEIGCKVDFNQGLDARLIVSNPNIPKLLSKIKWLNPVRLACDSSAMMKIVEQAAVLLRSAGLKPTCLFAYVLLTDLQSSYERINFLKKLDIMPFAQPYRDFTPKQIIPHWQRDMARWCNDKAILKSCDFKDYRPRKGFCCKEYFSV